MNTTENHNESDFEIRILGTAPPKEPLTTERETQAEEEREGNVAVSKKTTRNVIIAACALLCLTILLLFIFRSGNRATEAENSASTEEQQPEGAGPQTDALPDSLKNADYSRDTLTTTSVDVEAAKDSIPQQLTVKAETKTVNDIAIRLYLPEGSKPKLVVGRSPANNPAVKLAALAADIRADNGTIAGACVVDGQLLSKGHPKRGFCAIIGGEVTMGMSAETPLLERSIDNNGSFFRQFSYVHLGELGEQCPKNKAIRRALCLKDGRLLIAETLGRESIHDFSQALIDLGISEAIGLVGALPITVAEPDGDQRTTCNAWRNCPQATYLVWE